MIRSVALASLSALAITAAPAAAAVAPGHVAFSVASTIPESNVDASGAGPAVALPDGGVVMVANGPPAGLNLVQLRANGSIDPSFGSGGSVRIALPGGRFNPAQLLRQPDGRLIVVGMGFLASDKYELPRFTLVRLTANGALDMGFGSGGIAALDLQASCGGACPPAALAPDGSIVITGSTGQLSPDILRNPSTPSTQQWVVRRLTPAGATDPSFGTVAVGGPAGVATSGYGTVVRPSGSIVVLGIRNGKPHLVGLTATGAVDETFNSGQPALVPVDSFAPLLRDNGAIDVAGLNRVVRFTPAGTLDATYAGGTFDGFNRLYGPPTILPSPDGGTIVYAQRQFDPTPAGQPRIHLQRITPSGAVGASGDLTTTFGGGIAGARLAQNSFRGALVPRANGSYLAVGGVSVVQYTGEGTGHSAGSIAVAAYTPTLELDTSFGGPQQPARANVRLPRQRARTAAARHVVVARVTTNGAGLVRLRVRDGRDRVLAQYVAPAYAAGTTTLRIPLTKTGQRVLNRGHSVRVRVGHDFRDLLTARARGAASGRLR